MRCAACQFQNPEGLNYCGNCGRSLATAATAGERRRLSVMFCDLVESTALSERLDPEELRELVRAYQEVCAEVVERYQGHVAQYLGDGVLVYFGYPEAHEDDAQRAVHAGLEIIDALRSLNARRTFGQGESLAARVGIHTGLVVAGEMGGGRHRETLALGQAPNVAARLQALAGPNAVVVSAETHRLVEGYFDFDLLGECVPRGANQSVRVFQALRAKAVQTRFELAVSRGLSQFQGRSQELRCLQDAFSRARVGNGCFVAIEGDGGIGKSRLLHRFEQASAKEGRRWVVGRCSPYTENTALAPVLEAVWSLAGIEPGKDREERLPRLELLLRELGLGLGENLPLLARLFELDPPEDYRLAPTSPEKLRQATFGLLLELFVRASQRQPLIVCFEDLHWVDPSTLEWLGLFGERVRSSALLVVLTFRPTFDRQRLGAIECELIQLGRLAAQEVSNIIADISQGKKLPVEVVERIVQRTDGIALFVEELTKMILESGLLQQVGERYRLTGPLPDVSIPSTLHDSLMARLDRLGAGKNVAQVASVLGRKFSFAMLKAVAEAEEATLRAGLDQLVEGSLLSQTGSVPNSSYAFKHALIQDASYASLLKKDRRQLHARVAEVMQASSTEPGEGRDGSHPDVNARPELIAHHFSEAEKPAEALEYWCKAAEDAAERSANEEALRYVDRGSQQAQALPENRERLESELRLSMLSGQALTATKGYASPEVERAYTQAFELWERCDSPTDSGQDAGMRLLKSRLRCAAEFLERTEDGTEIESNRLFWVLWGFGAFHQARAELPEALEKAEHLLRLAQGNPALQLEGHFGAGSTQFFAGEFQSAREHLESGWECYRALERELGTSPTGHHAEILGCGYWALTLWHLGFVDQAQQQADRAVELARKANHPYSVVYTLTINAWLQQMKNDVGATFELAEQALKLAQEYGFPIALAWVTPVWWWARAQRGEVNEAIAALRQGMDRYWADGYHCVETYFLGLLADCHLRAGQVSEGLAVVEDALHRAASTGERFWEPELHRLRGELRLREQNPDRERAEHCFLVATEVARGRESRALELRAQLSHVALLESLGLLGVNVTASPPNPLLDPQEQVQALADSLAWFAEGLDTVDLTRAEALLGEIRTRSALRPRSHCVVRNGDRNIA